MKHDPDLQVATAKSIYKLLYGILDDKFNDEISETCTDVSEIFAKKGLASNEIKGIISCGLAVQIPSLEKLFSEFGITSLKMKSRCSSQYRQIKIDMFSDMQVFINLKQKTENQYKQQSKLFVKNKIPKIIINVIGIFISIVIMCFASKWVDLLENHILDVQGNFILYIVHPDAAKADQAFRNSL